jgi:hypothetical protein
MSVEGARANGLAVVRAAHTAIYIVMAASTFVVLYAALTGNMGRWLLIPIGLLSFEVIVFVGGGMRCPLTAIAVDYGAVEGGPLFDTFLPERITRYTFRIFAPLIVLGLGLLCTRWWMSAG